MTLIRVRDMSDGGDCYYCAHNALLANNHKWQNARMVHADITHSKTGDPYDHAYVVYDMPLPFPDDMRPPEWGDHIPTIEMVHDQSNSFKGLDDIPRVMYEMQARPNFDTMREYTLEEAVKQALESGHYGPWDGRVQKSRDIDEFLGSGRRHKALSSLGRIFADDEKHSKRYQDAIIEQLLEPTNQYSLTDAKTPTLFRAETFGDVENYPIGGHEFRYGRYFSPQRLTAEQYAQYQEKNRGLPSAIHEYEMPVPFSDDSVLNVPTVDFGSGIQGKKFEADSPEVNRVATMNDMTIPEAQKALQAWHSVYMGATPQSREEMVERLGPLMDAGYDYVTWPEFASAAFYPPVASSAFGSIDWGAGHEARRNRKAVDEWWSPARQAIMEELGIPHRMDNAMGKHTAFPQWAAYHIGEEDSAPEYRQYHGSPDSDDLAYKYQKVDYPNFGSAASIAERDLGFVSRWC